MNLKIKDLETTINEQIIADGLERENRLRNFIGERTNPLYQSFPVILFNDYFTFKWFNIKSKGENINGSRFNRN